MKLRRLELEGYRSFRGRTEIVFDPRITVVMGANDHGKTNLLEAIVHLNEEEEFSDDRDLNLEYEDRGDDFPYALFEFSLEPAEREELAKEQGLLQSQAAVEHAIGVARAEETAKKTELVEMQSRLDELTRLEAAAAAELEQAVRARDESPNPETRAKVGQARRQQAELKRSLRNANRAVTALHATVEHARNTVKLVELCQLELHASRAGEPPESALNDAIELAQAQAQSANEQLAIQSNEHQKARNELDEYRKQLEAAGKDPDKVQDDPELNALQEELTKSATGLTEARNAADSHQRELQKLKELEVVAERLGERKAFGIDALRLLNLIDIDQFDEASVPGSLSIERRGVGSARRVLPVGEISEEVVSSLIARHLPRAELVSTLPSIPDSVNAKQLVDSWFMRGIFHYAGLDPAEWDGIFKQTLRSSRRLQQASEQLNTTLRRSWIQGSDLTFRLNHSSGEEILLEVFDPAMPSTFIQASRRSSGFTHFFSLQTILHAREMDSKANSYLWLFDEPGMYLHPDGQRDLLKVLEALSDQNQLIYSTHSLFMINKNHPVRHRLIYKDENGSSVEGKPYKGRWAQAIGALGLALPGTILFAGFVLMTEGDTDPVLLYPVLQRLSDLGRIDVDLNSLSIMPTGDAANAEAMIRILNETSSAKPRIALLFDNDQGGRERRSRLRKVAERYDVAIVTLNGQGSTLEDHLLARDLLFEATAAHLADVKGSTADAITRDLLNVDEKLKNVSKMGWGKTLRAAASQVLGEPPSALGISRRYQELLEGVNDGDLNREEIERATNLAQQIIEALELPGQMAERDRIFEPTE